MNAETNKVVVSCECVEQSQCREEKQGAEQDGKANLDTATENILLAKEEDLPRIMEIYDIAKSLHACKRQSQPVEWSLSGPGDTADRYRENSGCMCIKRTDASTGYSCFCFGGGTDLCLYRGRQPAGGDTLRHDPSPVRRWGSEGTVCKMCCLL